MYFFISKSFVFIILCVSVINASTMDKCKHLLNRTTFGMSHNDLRYCLNNNYEASVKKLLDNNQLMIIPESYLLQPMLLPKKRKEMNRAAKQAFNKLQRQHRNKLKEWWIEQMLKTQNPFREKMTLFWHSHFTSAFSSVKQPSMMFFQNQLFRKHALGNFRKLLHEVVKDPAMLIYLNNNKNKKKHPNENFARELLELFTLGEGHYTEKDIKEAARALTGYSTKDYQFKYKRHIHDKKKKTFLGKTGNFDAKDIVEIILSQEQTAKFIVKKVWNEFVSTTEDEQSIERLAKTFRESNYEMKPLLYALFMSKEFQRSRAELIKSPIELLVGTLRTFGIKKFNLQKLVVYTRRLGQDIFNPPDVKGWRGHKNWISTDTLLLRKELLSKILRGEGVRKRTQKHLQKMLRWDGVSSEVALLLPIYETIEYGSRDSGTIIRKLLQHPSYQLK